MSGTAPVLDEELFEMFADVMADGLSRALARYSQAAQEYLVTVAGALPVRDFVAVARAAHPLKSSSQQVGAARLADLAAEMEALAGTPDPDGARLEDLRARAVIALEEAEHAFAARLSQGGL